MLGLLSFITMALTRRHQAVHDRLTHTTVQPRDATRVIEGDYVLERSPVEIPGMPSRARRVAVVLLYVMASFILMSLGISLIVTTPCLMDDACTSRDDLLMTILGVLWLVAVTGCIIAGWRGRLWGCRIRAAHAQAR